MTDTSDNTYELPLKANEVETYLTKPSKISHPHNSLFPQQPSAYAPIHKESSIEIQASPSSEKTHSNTPSKKWRYECFKYSLLVLTVLVWIRPMIHPASLFYSKNSPLSVYIVGIALQVVETFVYLLTFFSFIRKDSKKAETAVNLLKLYILLFAVLNIGMVAFLTYSERDDFGPVSKFMTDEQEQSVKKYVLIGFSVVLALEMIIYSLILYGAVKTRNFLRQYNSLKGESTYAPQSSDSTVDV